MALNALTATVGTRTELISSSCLMTLSEARRVLGTTAIDMSDDDIRLLIKQVDILTDIVAAKATGSTIKSHIANSDDEAHNDK